MKKLFSKKETLQSEDEIFFSLAPRDDVDEKNTYSDSFMQAIKHKSKIIAFTGRYGIGKTSVINSILKKLDGDYKSIRISLGNYKQATGDETDIGTNEIETKILQQIIYTIDENKAVEARTRILRFGDEVSHGKNHSRDHFQQVLLDITNYNNYCLNHKEFKNDMTKMTAERIKEDYMTRDRNNNFLE